MNINPFLQNTYVFMVDLLNTNVIKDDYSLVPLMFMRKYSS